MPDVGAAAARLADAKRLTNEAIAQVEAATRELAAAVVLERGAEALYRRAVAAAVATDAYRGSR